MSRDEYSAHQHLTAEALRREQDAINERRAQMLASLGQPSPPSLWDFASGRALGWLVAVFLIGGLLGLALTAAIVAWRAA